MHLSPMLNHHLIRNARELDITWLWTALHSICCGLTGSEAFTEEHAPLLSKPQKIGLRLTLQSHSESIVLEKMDLAIPIPKNGLPTLRLASFTAVRFQRFIAAC